MNDREILSALHEKREERNKLIEEHTPQIAKLQLNDVVRGLSDISEEFSQELTFRMYSDQLKINPLVFRIRLPEPAFFFIENGSPFIPSLLGSVAYKGDKQVSRLENYMYQVRTCCASLREPKISIDELKKLPEGIILLLYEQIVNSIAPPYAVALMRCFYRQAQSRDGKSQMLEVYLMSKSGNRPTVEYIVPSVKNPYIVAAIEKIIFEIGFEYDKQIMEMQLKAASFSAFK